MKKILFIFFFITIFSNLYTEEERSIIISHIGEQDSYIQKIIINTYKEGIEIEHITWNILNYFLVTESTFDEIINLIYNNNDLFGNRQFGYWLRTENRRWRITLFPDEHGNIIIPIDRLRAPEPYGINVYSEYHNSDIQILSQGIIEFIYRLEDFGCFELCIKNEEEKYFNLVERRSSALFFSYIYNIIKNNNDNNRLLKELEKKYRYFHFISFSANIENLMYENIRE